MMYYNARPGLGSRLSKGAVIAAKVKPYLPGAPRGYDVVYARLKAGLSVYPSEITREFAIWVMTQYGIGDPVFHKATELLRQKLAAEVDITPTVDEAAVSTYIPGPEVPAVVDPRVANGFTEPTGTVPTFIETAQAQTSPLLKYGLLAVGAFIFIDSLKRTRPRRRSVRKRSVRRRRKVRR